MMLQGELPQTGASVDLRPVVDESDWNELLDLVCANHAEGKTTGGLDLDLQFSLAMVASYRAKSDEQHFHLAMADGLAVAYGAYAVAPNGVGMIEHIFTLPAARRRGVASAMIVEFARRLRRDGCRTVFLARLPASWPSISTLA